MRVCVLWFMGSVFSVFFSCRFSAVVSQGDACRKVWIQGLGLTSCGVQGVQGFGAYTD